ncbi:MAG: lysophospholipid acyltransferase family protein [Ignavibacteriae bacterium]|nr:lysophospholipid acyltransferase family protein [Ignavibacteriota bacterium]
MIAYIQYLLFRLICWAAQKLSFRMADRVGRMLGRIVFSVIKVRKNVTLDNLRRAFPERTEADIRLIAKSAYENYGIAIIEFLWASNKSVDVIRQVVRVAHADVMTTALSKGKGVILLSGHFGAWEFLIPAPFAYFNVQVTGLAQRQSNVRVDAIIDGIRRRFGNDTIPMGVASRGVLQALAKGNIIIILGDQSASKESEYVQFFGRPAATHRGAAAFSLKARAPIVMGFVVRQPDGTHVLTFEEVEQSDLDPTKKENVLELTRRHVAVLEKWIRKHPDHWLWMHKRWKHSEYHAQQPALTEAE